MTPPFDKFRATGSGMAIEGTFFFDPADRIYGDHFPGRPVVPGSLIINAFLEAGTSAGCCSSGAAVENFRFREFVAPGLYAFSIEERGNGWQCRLVHDGRTVADGRLCQQS